MSENIKLMFFIAFALWAVAIGMLFIPPSSPVTFSPPDSVSPIKVKAGESITISRNLTVHRTEHVYVLRAMIKGNCVVPPCEVLDLPAGQLILERGEYKNLSRVHLIPTLATPGVWRLVFSIQWEDRLGRRITKMLPELMIEVVP